MGTPVTWTVRRALAADTPALARFRLDFRGPRAPNVETEAAFLERCAAWMKPRLSPDSAWRAWALERDGHVAGTIWMQVVEKLPNPTAEPERHAYVSNFYVAPEHRNGGGGETLLRAVLDECASLNIDSVFLWPSARSRTLYQRHGFTMSDDVFVLKR